MTKRAYFPLFLSFLAVFSLWFGSTSIAQSNGQAIIADASRFHPVTARRGMVVSQEELATRVGVRILEQGGNAIDAAVAVGFAQAVTLPRAGNIGGGGFMLVHLAGEGKTVAIDYREAAPKAAWRDMYLGADGEVDRDKALFSYQSVGVPGTVAGLTHALEKYGSLPLNVVMAPAIELAEKGMLISEDLAISLDKRQAELARWPETARIFLKADGGAPQQGEWLQQKELAKSLKAIARQGADAFYRGSIAKLLVADMQANGGLMTAEDLANYRVVEREPVVGNYRGYDVYSMPLPSSGGLLLIHILNVLEGFDLAAMGHNSAASIHLLSEVMKRAYAVRSRYLGDPDFVDVPVEKMVSDDYADQVRGELNLERVTPSAEIESPSFALPDSPNTTHFSVMDRFGNAVSNTYSLNVSYGTGIVAKGTGILLNNTMDDFSAKPGSPNVYGLIGDKANAIEPAKRPLSSMTPTLVLKDGKVWLVTGTPGGSRITTTVLQIVLNVIDYQMDVATATAAPRVHHQWWPDELRVEQGISPDTQALLRAKGHKISSQVTMGATETIMYQHGVFYGAADTRRRNALALGF